VKCYAEEEGVVAHRIGAWLGLLLTVSLLPLPVQAQTTEDLFESSLLHALYLDLNPADWQLLKQNYLASVVPMAPVEPSACGCGDDESATKRHLNYEWAARSQFSFRTDFFKC